MFKIKRLDAVAATDLVPQLCDLLGDAVNDGASIGFLPPLDGEEAAEYWRGVINAVDAGSTLLLAAFDSGDLIGSVQLALAMKPNAPHRAEVQKLMVQRRARGRGVARRLMSEIEALARQNGRTLLVLDTRQGDVSEKLYSSIGYIRVGAIPGYVYNADGTMSATVVYYRQLEGM